MDESNDTAYHLAIAAMDKAFGRGVEEAHKAILTDPATRRIYDCAIRALMEQRAAYEGAKAT